MKRKYNDDNIINNNLHNYFINQTDKNLDDLISTYLKHIKIKNNF